MEAVTKLYDNIINDKILTRRINITANKVIREEDESKNNTFEQIDLFTNYEEINKKKEQEEKEPEMTKEERLLTEIRDLLKKQSKEDKKTK